MSNTEMWALVVGFFLPPFLAVIQQPSWPSGLRSVVAFTGCLAAAVGTVYVTQDHWDWRNWIGTSLFILVTAMVTYRNLWKPTGVAPSIESSTSPR